LQDKTSILILTLNGLSYTRLCLDSVFRNTTSESFEVVIVDQGSKDATRDYLRTLAREHANVKVVENDHNVGFAAGCNQAAKLAEGSMLLFLNNDVIVPPNWLEDLATPMLKFDKLAGTGPTSNATGELQFDRESVRRVKNVPGDVYSYSASKRQMMGGKVWYFHRLAGFCLLLKRDVFDEVGGFNDRLTFYEDDDLCRRIVEHGYRLAIIPAAFVHHFGSSTFKQVRANVDLLMQINRFRYLWMVAKNNRPSASGNSPLVSVITTTWNRPRELELAIKSIREQTYGNWEAIVVNDGGQDVGEVVRVFEDQRIKYINSEHVGRSVALNLALSKASGKYLAYLDDDDVWYPEHLEACVDFLERHSSIGLAYTKSVRKTFRGREDGTKEFTEEFMEPTMDFDLNRMLTVNWIPIIAMVHRTDLVRQMGGFRDLPILEDWDLLLRLSSLTEFAHVPLVTGEYFVNLAAESRNEKMRHEDPARYVEILNAIRLSQSASPDRSEALRITAEEFSQVGDLPKAIELIKTALVANPFNIWALKKYVDLCYRTSSDVDVKALEEFLAERPDRSRVWRIYAREFMKTDEYEKALRALGFALLTRETDNEGLLIYRLMSFCYSKLGMGDTAIACLVKSLNLGELGGNPSLDEGAILDHWFGKGLMGSALKAMTYFHLYSRRWGRLAAVRKMLRRQDSTS
jgi:GT2 family glycosyltransferase